jgi:pimeloyl-ACP methyl ester carboxylesterase
VYALDFTGHGQSTVPKGGGYTCETLLADANTALGHLGKATVMGRGLGAYVALLVAGGRPERARGAILQDGPGLTGGDSGSTPSFVRFADPGKSAPPDPVAIVELATDVRLPEYAAIFARLAVQYSGLPTPISICALERPAWLSAIAAEPGVEVVPLPTALARYARENA